MVASLGLSFRPPILEDTSQCERSHWWLLGEVSGIEYLVSSWGLIQPRARSGIIAPGYPFDQPEHDITITHIHYKTLGVPDCQCVWISSRVKDENAHNLLGWEIVDLYGWRGP